MASASAPSIITCPQSRCTDAPHYPRRTGLKQQDRCPQETPVKPIPSEASSSGCRSQHRYTIRERLPKRETCLCQVPRRHFDGSHVPGDTGTNESKAPGVTELRAHNQFVAQQTHPFPLSSHSLHVPPEQKESPVPPLLTPYISYKFVHTRLGDPSSQDGEMVPCATESGAF